MHLSYLNLLSYESSLYFSWMYSNVIETWEGSRVSSEELLHTPPCDLLTVVPVQRNGGLWTSFAITVNVGSRQLALEVLVLPQSLVVPGEPAQSAVLDKPPPLLCLMPLIPETHIWLWSCCPASFSADPKSRFFSCGRLTNKMIPGASGVILGCGWSCEPRLCQGRLDVSKPVRVEPQGHLLKRGETKFNACTLSP